MSRLLILSIVTSILLTACWVASESGEGPEPVISFEPVGSPLFVDTLIDSDIDADVVVIGFLVADSDGVLLCGAIMESFPPQCGSNSVTVTGIERLDVDFQESQGVRWTDSHVTVWGHFSDRLLTVLDGDPPSDSVIQTNDTE